MLYGHFLQTLVEYCMIRPKQRLVAMSLYLRAFRCFHKRPYPLQALLTVCFDSATHIDSLHPRSVFSQACQRLLYIIRIEATGEDDLGAVILGKSLLDLTQVELLPGAS